jgi:hypothetical protein
MKIPLRQTPPELVHILFEFIDMVTLARCVRYVSPLRHFAHARLDEVIRECKIFVGSDEDLNEEFAFDGPAHVFPSHYTFRPFLMDWGLAMFRPGGFVTQGSGLEVTFRHASLVPYVIQTQSRSDCHLGYGCLPEWHSTVMRVGLRGTGVGVLEHRSTGFDAILCDYFVIDLDFFLDCCLSPDKDLYFSAAVTPTAVKWL